MGIMFLDFETTGKNPKSALPIQIGLVFVDDDGKTHTFKENILWERVALAKKWNEAAAEVHKISFEDCVLKNSYYPNNTYLVEDKLLDFVNEHMDEKSYKNNLCGWNVGTFDFPFLKAFFPDVAERFSYVSYDMNSILLGAGRRWDKNDLKAEALEQLKDEGVVTPDGGEHDALVDSLICARICQNLGVL